MGQPKIKTMSIIEYNGNKFQEGDIVVFVWDDCGVERNTIGCIEEISDRDSIRTVKFDCSERFHSILKEFNICNLKSIRYVEDEEE